AKPVRALEHEPAIPGRDIANAEGERQGSCRPARGTLHLAPTRERADERLPRDDLHDVAHSWVDPGRRASITAFDAPTGHDRAVVRTVPGHAVGELRERGRPPDAYLARLARRVGRSCRSTRV